MIHAPEQQTFEEFREHQEIILPVTSQYFGKKNLDVGCGNGLTSLVLQEVLNVEFILCDVIDMRAGLSKHLPFYSIKNGMLPFADKSFDAVYLQYVLHHIATKKEVMDLLSEACRVSARIIIVEEIAGEQTDILTAIAFDKKVNQIVHPGVEMKVYNYFTKPALIEALAKYDLRIIRHEVISGGAEENGFLETHVFVAE